MAIFCQKNQIIPIFCRIPLVGMYLFQKNQQFVFSSFFTTTSIRGDFWPICHLTPNPWVTPPGQPLTYLPLCFLCPTSPKKMLDHENLTAFAIFQGGGWVFKFGLFWPFLANFEWAERSEGGTKMPNDGFSLLYTWYTVPKHPWSMFNQFYAILEHPNGR